MSNKNNEVTMLSKLNFQLKKSKIGNLITKVFRNKRQLSYKNLKGGRRKSLEVNVKQGLLSKIALLIILLICPLFLVTVHLSQFLKFDFNPYNRESIDYDRKLPREEYNILVLGFDSSSEEYRFIDLAVLFSINSETAQLKTYGINPNFMVSDSLGEQYTLRSLYNNVDARGTDPMVEVMNGVEGLMGVRVDRYISFDLDEDFNRILSKWGIEIDLEDEDSKLFGDKLSKVSQVKFLLDKSVNDDVRARRQVLWVNNFLGAKSNLTFFYRIFWNYSELNGNIYTDMTRKEIFQLSFKLMSYEKPILSSYLKLNFGRLVNIDNTSEGIIADSILVDEDIKSIFSDLNVMQEQSKIEVFNATQQKGLAVEKSRLFENLGSNVINYGNYPEHLDENILFITLDSPEKMQNTIDMIVKSLRGDVRIATEEYRYNYSGDLILVVGETL
jgi:hypothetical protein